MSDGEDAAAAARVADDLDDVEWVPADDLDPFEGNPRRITDAELRRLERSVRRWGLREPIVARREDGLVVGGHQRLRVARRLGYDQVPVAWVEGLSDEDAAALNVALNNPQAQGDWDERKLSELVAALRDGGYDLEHTGFTDGRLQELLEAADPGEVDWDEVDEDLAEDVDEVECPECGHSFAP